MDRATLARRLSRVERRIAVGVNQIARQLQFIANLERMGNNSTSAESLLNRLAQRHMTRIAERDQVAREIDSLRSVNEPKDAA
jgi:hypothetical protein